MNTIDFKDSKERNSLQTHTLTWWQASEESTCFLLSFVCND